MDWDEAEATGLIESAPEYGDGSYNSTLSEPDPQEWKLYNRREEREDVSVREVIEQLVTEKEESFEDPELMQWMSSLFAAPTAKPRPFVSLNKFARYDPATGFQLAVDGGHKIGEGKTLAFALYSISPPASFYQEFKLTEEVQMAHKMDWDSLGASPMWADDRHTFRDIPFDKFSVAVIDIRLITFAATEDKTGLKEGSVSFEDFGWTVMPLFTEDEYVRLGIYQLPLFKGKVDTDTLEKLQQKE
eukprot:504521_1